MKKISQKQVILIVLLFVFILWIIILLTNTRILISEVKVETNQYYFVEGFGNITESNPDTSFLVCTYFNGWKTIKEVWKYPLSESCIFITNN